MAGDWIKVEENMTDKPEVAVIGSILKIEPDSVAGKLLRVWAWASRNCNADGVTNVTAKCFIDRISGVTGFADAMTKAGWLIDKGNELLFPNFNRHCSQTAKERANANRRVAKHRSGCNGESVTNVTVQPLQKPLPEKRREEYNKDIGENGSLLLTQQPVSSKSLQEESDAAWLGNLASNPAYAGIDVKTQHAKMSAWCSVNHKEPTRRRFINWLNRCERPLNVKPQTSATRENKVYS